MTYTVATLPIPSQSHAWIKKKLEAAGYGHSIDGDMLDMTHIALTKLDSFEFAGNEDASLTDVALYISEIAFKAGFDACVKYSDGLKAASDGFVSDARHTAWSNWEPSEQMKDHIVEGFQAMRDEVAANIEAQSEPYLSILKRCSAPINIDKEVQ